MKQKILSRIAFALCLGQVLLVLASWLWTAANPETLSRSLLSAEGIRWFFGRFSSNVSSYVLVYLLVGSIAYGTMKKSGLLEYRGIEYRQRVAFRVVLFELLVAVLLMVTLALLPHAILLNVMGGLYPSSFSQSFLPYVALVMTVVSCTYGLMSGRLDGFQTVFSAMSWGIGSAAPLFVLYLLLAQLVCSLLYCWN